MDGWQPTGNFVRGKGPRPSHRRATGTSPGLAQRPGPEGSRRLRERGNRQMIRTILMLIFWALAAPVAAIIGFSASFIMGDVRGLYRVFVWGGWGGVWI